MLPRAGHYVLNEGKEILRYRDPYFSVLRASHSRRWRSCSCRPRTIHVLDGKKRLMRSENARAMVRKKPMWWGRKRKTRLAPRIRTAVGYSENATLGKTTVISGPCQ